MKPWLFVGAKVVAVKFGDTDYPDMPNVDHDAVHTVRDIVDCRGHIGIRLEGVTGCTHPLFGDDCPWDASAFAPVSTINTDATVAALKQTMRDHVANASGGAGIRKVRA